MAMPDELMPLYSVEAEMGSLGSMLLSERAAEEVATLLQEEDFYRPAHRMIFRAMKALLVANKPIDFLTLREELTARGHLADIGGEDFLINVAEFTPSPANSGYYAGIVQDRATQRRLEQAGRKIVGLVHDPDFDSVDQMVDAAEQEVFEVGRRSLGKYFQSVRTLATEVFQDVDRFVESGKPMTGTKVGFTDLDRMTTGFYPGNFIVVGARPAMGKTSLVLDFAINMAREAQRSGGKGAIAIFSLEMTSIELVRRMVSMMSGVSGMALKADKPLSEWQYGKLADACDALYSLPIFIDDFSDVTPLEMRGKCRRLKAEHGLSMIVIDYLQLIKGNAKTENRVQQISEIARACKSMAKELEVPVVALSQLSRAVENRDDKRPQLADIRESGSIEAEADLVMLLYREAYYKKKEEGMRQYENSDEVEEAEIIVAKHRNGPTGVVKLGFQPAYARYRNIIRDGFEDGDGRKQLHSQPHSALNSPIPGEISPTMSGSTVYIDDE